MSSTGAAIDPELKLRGQNAALQAVRETLPYAERQLYGQQYNELLLPLAKRDWLGLFMVARHGKPHPVVIFPTYRLPDDDG